jgi:hypothetical protein
MLLLALVLIAIASTTCSQLSNDIDATTLSSSCAAISDSSTVLHFFVRRLTSFSSWHGEAWDA